MGVVAFSGSRTLSTSFYPLVKAAVNSVIHSGRGVSVGCCVGLDSFVLSALASLAPPLRGGCSCFSAFGSGGVGSCSLSAVAEVSAWASIGGSVVWWSGGSEDLDISVRLSVRSAAVIASASVSVVVFFSSAASVGSLLAAQRAVNRGLPVFAFACGFSAADLPLLGAGLWVSVGGSGVWSSAFRWSSSQSSLF